METATPEPDLASMAEDAGVRKGLGGFAPPPPMEVGKWAIVSFSVAPDAPTLESETQGRTIAAPASIYIARKMRVKLLDHPAFEAKAKNAEEQDTGLDGAATWLWDVLPKAGGRHSLVAQVEVLGITPGGKRVTLDTYTRQVQLTVKVRAVDRAKGAINDAKTIGESLTDMFGSWGKAAAALGALLAALATVAWRLGLRKKKPGA